MSITIDAMLWQGEKPQRYDNANLKHLKIIKIFLFFTKIRLTFLLFCGNIEL